MERPNKYLRGLTTAFAVGTAGLGLETIGQAQSESIVASKIDAGTSEQVETWKYRDNPEFDREVLGGEFTVEERAARTETIMPGIEIFHDIGLDWYRVQPGDTKESIRDTLSLLPEYTYLGGKKQQKRTIGFNIAEKSLHDVEWLPIPVEKTKLLINDEDFLVEVKQGIEELTTDECYGETAQKIIDKIGEDAFSASMLAVAKMESGEHIGSSQFSLYDATNHTFSISPYHVLDKGAGKRARHNLHKTIGQMNSPKNAVKLLVGFMAEKMNEPASIFPIDQHYEQFATQYNGADWRRMNPNYATDLDGYYQKALKKLRNE